MYLPMFYDWDSIGWLLRYVSNIAGILDSCPVVKAKDARTQNQLHNYLKSAS